MYQFCDYLKQANMNIIWRCDSRTDILSKEMIDKMQEVGCTSVHIGIESGSQDVINKINKHISLERSEELLAYMSQKGLQVMCSFIIGHHCDTHETIKETIDMALKFRKKYKATVGISINTPWAKEIMCYANKQNIHVVASFIIGHFCDTERTIQETISLMEILRNSGIEVSVAGCVPFPGTPLYEHKDKLGISIHAHSWQEYDFSNMIISTSYLSQEQLRELLFSAVTKIS